MSQMLKENRADCSICHKANRVGVKYCSYCGNPLVARTCPHCGRDNRAQARRCRHCGKPLLLTGYLPRDQVLGARYRIIRSIARSGMGAIYQAADIRLPGKVWALKEMSESAFTTGELPHAIEMFRQEMQILAACQHPNLPQIGDFFTYQGKSFIVMEFIDGTTLDALLKSSQGFLPLDSVLSWGEQLCAVLGYLHGQKPPIIHRDVKPLNVMVDQNDGLVKLIDFGIARFQRRSQRLGESGECKGYGTVGYAPPEQFRGGAIDARADIYSLGVTLHQLLTKHDPANAVNPFVLPPIQQVNPGVPDEVVQALGRAMRMNVEDRYPSAQEMRKALVATQVVLHKGRGIPAGAPPDSVSGASNQY